ncbi:spore protease YyaC [Wukongibacter baidiensis]|uniref:spore protease YyaC n=1 Tax=Wukongibacter baidiensis TaxID=1723361 RepID=UPI003D7F5856
MDKLLINMYDKKSIEYLANHLKLLLKEGQKISILCIGTDRIIPDSLGPMIGTILSENIVLDDIKIIGTLESPLHALNMKKRIKRELDKDELVIAIDANKGARVGEIQVLDHPISPGKGLRKNLPQVGHISIVGTTLENGELTDIYDHKIRLGDIYKMAKTISSSLSLAINELRYE